jgi:hypothetical protein
MRSHGSTHNWPPGPPCLPGQPSARCSTNASCFPPAPARIRRGYRRGIPRGLSSCQRRKAPRRRFACGGWGAVVRGCLKIWFTSLGGPPRPARFSFWDPEQKLTQATEQLVHALEPLIDPICRAHGVELVDVRCLREPAGMVIRVITGKSRAWRSAVGCPWRIARGSAGTYRPHWTSMRT